MKASGICFNGILAIQSKKLPMVIEIAEEVLTMSALTSGQKWRPLS